MKRSLAACLAMILASWFACEVAENPTGPTGSGGPPPSAAPDTIVAWGLNNHGQCNVPAPSSGFVALAGAAYHSLVLRADSTVVSWGLGVVNGPVSDSRFVAISGGTGSLGLRADSTIVTWGLGGCEQCGIPEPNAGFIAIAAGIWHGLGIRADSSIVAWGYGNQPPNCDLPGVNANFVAVAAGYEHSLALRADGSYRVWGCSFPGLLDIPERPAAPLIGTDIVAGKWHGSLATRGNLAYGPCGEPLSTTGVIAIAAGDEHSLALRADGSILAWGDCRWGLCSEPVPNTGFVAIATGDDHNLALKADGTIVAWGSNEFGQREVPEPNAGFIAIAAGTHHSLGIKAGCSK